jgi:hypothetical protein
MAHGQIAQGRVMTRRLLRDSNTLDGNGALAVELVGIPVVALLLAVLESLALVVLEHAMTTAVSALAEAAVADNGLRAVLAILEGAADLLGRHAAAEREGEVESGIGPDGVISQGGVGRREVLAGVDYAQIRGCREIGAEGEERAQSAYRGI